MFPQFSATRLPGKSSDGSRRTLSLAPAVQAALFLCLLLGLAQFSLAQAGNPIGALIGKSSQPAPNPAPTVAAAPTVDAAPAPIPLPDVSTRAEELMRLLRGLKGQLPTGDQLDAVKASLAERDTTLAAKQKEVTTLLAGSLSGLELREQETYWHVFSAEGAATRRQLLDWANTAQSAMQQLQTLQPEWNLTLEENKSTRDLSPTLDVIRDSVKSIQTTKAQAQDLLRVIVNLQVSAANQHQAALDVLDQLKRSREQLKGRLLHRDSLPLWQVLRRRQADESTDFFRSASARMIGIESFARDNAGMFVGFVVLTLLSVFGAYRLSIASRKVKPSGSVQEKALKIASHWLALGILPPLLLVFLLGPFAPLSLIGIAILLSFFSIVVLLPPLIEPRFITPLYCLVAVYAFQGTLNWLALSPAAKREAQFLAAVAAALFFAFLLRPKRLAAIEQPGRSHQALIFGARVAVVILAVAQVVNLFGFYKLAQSMSGLCLYSTFIALAAFTAQRVFTLLFVATLELPSAERLAVVRLHRAAICRWGTRAMRWAAILVWVGATLDLMGARIWVQDRLSALMNFDIAGDASNITLGGVLGFFAILLVGFALSTSLRFLLREEVLKRLHLKRGIPELISTTVHYLLLLLVFLFAVNAGGVALNKFTVITGALGVGVGFGLQNIINNFVSGLILQFERPIREGDVVEIQAGLTGSVTRIGIRSSTVQTFQGAEVIIPNATFISSNVTNWTLSEAKRRLELPVGVAYGTDAKLVKELLERPALQHPDVLTSPAPAVFFKGFGESSLDFELQFWVMQESNTVKVKSEVALEVMRLLAEANVEIPFPQRDLHLRGVTPATTGLVAGNGSGAGSEESHAAIELRNRSKSSSGRE